ncbi:MAG: ABC transporter permease [Acidobacteriaceae bacterium]|nr:ABC transporter permease [Acidobacteriaceae bacterium]
MAEEFAFHLRARTEDLVRSGISSREAERRARLEFGGKEHYRIACRESHRVNWLDEVARNSRYALRGMLQAPLFSFMGIVSLALGLAAVGTTFAVVNTVLLRPLPFADSERIVTISQKVPVLGSSPSVVTAEEFQRWQQTGLFDSAALIDTAAYTLERRGQPERIYGASVTPEFFRVFGVQPIAGRSFSKADATEGQSSAIILSYRLWSRDFGSDSSVIGKQISLSGAPMTVIGVMPAGFAFPRLADVSQIMNWAPEQSEFWIPFVITPQILEEGNFNYYALGRLRKGVTREHATAELLPIAVHLFKDKEIKYPAYKRLIEQTLGSLNIYVTGLRDTMTWGIHDALWMILAAVGVLFMLVLFNLGNLLLTRNASRIREYTVRQALGASRWQLFREAIFHEAALAGLASILACVLTASGINILRVTAANRVPRLYDLRFSLSDLVLLGAIALLTAVIFGALSQFLFSERLLAWGLNSQGRTSTGDQRANRLRSMLISAEVGMSAVLLVASGLLLKSFHNVMRQQPGFNPHGVLTVDVAFNAKNTDKPEKRIQHIRELTNELSVLPGVTSASIVNRLPLTGDNEIHNVTVLGKPVAQTPENVSAEYRVIGATYFRTMQIPLIAGRPFRPDDAANLAIINQKMASRLWPGKTAIGQRFTDGDNPPLTVIGVVGNVHCASLEKPEMMQFYRLFTANPYWVNTFVIRSEYAPQSLIPLVEKAIWRLDPSEPVTHAQTMEQLLKAVTLQRRFETELLSSFAFASLFFAGLGLFSVASLSATRRTREFGIRLAVGASGVQIVGLELQRTAKIVAAGLGLGLVASLAVARGMSSLLYRVAPWSQEVFILAALVLIASALAAGWLPAIRAARIDPASALRNE